MNIQDISLPEIYLSSADFRFFIDWFRIALSKIQFDIQHMIDLYDPFRCPSKLLWMLCDTVGYKYDDRLPPAYNRFVLRYFMSMIRNKGSLNGMLLAAGVNVAQHYILSTGKDNNILYDRLEDVSLPVNSVYVNSHVEEGYIEVVYFSTDRPVDACLEYVRPLGMYMFDYAGVRYDAKSHISVDARLTNMVEAAIYNAISDETERNHVATTQWAESTNVGHYSREDYARLQKGDASSIDYDHKRRNVWYRNSISEENTTVIDPQHQTAASSDYINPGYRALYSLQLCNNDHIVRSLIRNDQGVVAEPDPIFSIPVEHPTVYNPESATVSGSYNRQWNLKYNEDVDHEYTHHAYTPPSTYVYDVDTIEERAGGTEGPAVNPPMFTVGSAISLNDTNSEYYNPEE